MQLIKGNKRLSVLITARLSLEFFNSLRSCALKRCHLPEKETETENFVVGVSLWYLDNHELFLRLLIQLLNETFQNRWCLWIENIKSESDDSYNHGLLFTFYEWNWFPWTFVLKNAITLEIMYLVVFSQKKICCAFPSLMKICSCWKKKNFLWSRILLSPDISNSWKNTSGYVKFASFAFSPLV